MSIMKKATASLFGSLLILGAVATPSQAVRDVDQDGLVNVSVGNVEILNDVNVAVAANVVAQICDVKVGPVIALGRAVDRSGDEETVCQVRNRDVTITQN